MENINTAIAEWQKIVSQNKSYRSEAQARARKFQELYMVQFDINTRL